MTKIVVDEDCGNAPKKLLLRDLQIALAKQDAEYILGQVSDNIRWDRVGDRLVEGKEQFEEELEKLSKRIVSKLTIRTILTHGNAGAVDGVIVLENGKQLAFCEVYRFSSAAKNAKIKEIMSYVIEL